jgi:hypothetical protein
MQQRQLQQHVQHWQQHVQHWQQRVRHLQQQWRVMMVVMSRTGMKAAASMQRA